MRRMICSLLFLSMLAACQGRPAVPFSIPSIPSGTPFEIPTPIATTRLPTITLSPTSTSTPSGPWQPVAVHNVHQNVMAAGFLTEEFGITVGTAPGFPFYTTDGGKTWNAGNMQADCRYGLDIVDTQVAWASGGAMNVRRSIDGGSDWPAVTDYGRGTTRPFHTISFLDDTTGWIASLYMFGSTRDGGTTWSDVPLPSGLNDISSVLLVAPNTGFLLDFSGVLYHTQDNGTHWTIAGKLDLGGLVIPKAVYQMSAMRFTDREHGLIVVSEEYRQGKVKAFHTSDGGLTWSSELVPVISGPVFLSRLEPLLTVLDSADIMTVMRYSGK